MLTRELRQRAKEAVADLMRSPGVEVCMKQGSVGFENYVQVGLAGWLAEEFPQKMVVIESDPKSNVAADIIVKNSGDSVDVVAAIELKIVRLGTVNGDGIRMELILNDIGKLKGTNSLKNADKALVCCVYLKADSIADNSWGTLNAGKGKKDKRGMVLKEAGDQEAELFPVNGVNACVDFFMVSS